MTIRSGGWGWAGAGALTLAVFLWPLRAGQEPTGLEDAGALVLHILFFGVLAGTGMRRWRASGSPFRIWLAVAGLAAMVEWLQPLAGRSGGWLDALAGAVGAGWMCAGPKRGAWGGLILLSTLPLAGLLVLRGMEMRAFPVLADPSTAWGRRNWTLNHLEMGGRSKDCFRLVPAAGDSTKGPAKYPGMFRRPAVRDWREARAWAVDFYWPRTEPAWLAIRVDDAVPEPAYADRFQKEILVTQGWNHVRIAMKEMTRTAGGRLMKLDEIRRWGVFLVSPGPFDYFLLGPVRLIMSEGPP